MEIIRNNQLEVCISTKGAEMQNLRDAATQREYLWQGDPAFWGGRSPILFPIVGGMWNGECRRNGKTYRIPKHGFVRSRTWEVVEREENAICFACEITAEEREIFPTDYRVETRFSLEDRKVKVDFRVKNLGAEEMFFQIGGHPALNLPDWTAETPVAGYLQLDGEPKSLLRAGTQGCTEPERVCVPLNEDGLVPLCVETFANEALIFDDHQVSAATLLNLAHQPVARVESTAPVWLFWSPTGLHSPFVCPEPWYGLCDRQGFDGDISERPFINRLDPGAEWHGGYSIEVF